MKRLLLLVLMGAMPLAFGADSQGTYKVYGAASCGDYVDERAKRDSSKQIHYSQTRFWVAGWITAYNSLAQDTNDIMGNADMPSVLLWLEGYCKANPLEHLSDAMQAFTIQQRPKRKRSAN